MHMKYFFMFLIFLEIQIVFGQSKTSFGITYSISRIYTNYETFYVVSNNSGFSYYSQNYFMNSLLGFNIQYSITKKLSFYTGLVTSTQTEYFEFPFGLMFYPKPWFFVGGGLNFGTNSNITQLKLNPRFIPIGIGFELNSGINITISKSLGLQLSPFASFMNDNYIINSGNPFTSVGGRINLNYVFN